MKPEQAGCVFSVRISHCCQNAEHHQLLVADLRSAGSGSHRQRLPRPSQGRKQLLRSHESEIQIRQSMTARCSCCYQVAGRSAGWTGGDEVQQNQGQTVRDAEDEDGDHCLIHPCCLFKKVSGNLQKTLSKSDFVAENGRLVRCQGVQQPELPASA